MANTYNNKIIYDGKILMDLTGDTVTPDKLAQGITAHDKSGAPITGTNTYDSDTSDATVAVAEILKDKTAYARGTKLTGTMPNNGKQIGTITTKTQTITIKQGYHDGSGSVGIDSDEQAKLISENIREGITILGIEGSMTGTEDAKPQAKEVTPSSAQQVVLPDTGYNYLSQVIVKAIPYAESDNAAGGKTVTIG